MGTPWTFVALGLGLLTWPLYIGVLVLCVAFEWSQWVANVAGIILLLSGVLLCGATALAWYRTQRQRVMMAIGSFLAWVIVGWVFYFFFGHLVKEVAKQ